jgi:hypothetical protein
LTAKTSFEYRPVGAACPPFSAFAADEPLDGDIISSKINGSNTLPSGDSPGSTRNVEVTVSLTEETTDSFPLCQDFVQGFYPSLPTTRIDERKPKARPHLLWL